MGLGMESRCLAGSDPAQEKSRRPLQTGKGGVSRYGMLWTRGPPTKHLHKQKKKKKAQID